MKTMTLTLTALLALAGCAQQIPVAVITKDGRILRGTNSLSMGDGSFTVTDGKLTCSGSYNSFQMSRTISMPVLCSDGRKGIVRSVRDTATSGSGIVRLSDGSEADFIFGPAALSF